MDYGEVDCKTRGNENYETNRALTFQECSMEVGS
jgi:hypothetical protein